MRSILWILLCTALQISWAQQGAADFRNTSSYIQVPNDAANSWRDEGTVACWVKPSPDNNGVAYGTLIAKGGEYQLLLNQDGEIRYCLGVKKPGWTYIKTGVVIPPDKWTHLALTYNRGETVLYVNGSQAHTTRTSPFITDLSRVHNELWIGNQEGARNRPDWQTAYEGLIDEVEIWNKGLNPAEVAMTYCRREAAADQQQLVYYDFDSRQAGDFGWDRGHGGGIQIGVVRRLTPDGSIDLRNTQEQAPSLTDIDFLTKKGMRPFAIRKNRSAKLYMGNSTQSSVIRDLAVGTIVYSAIPLHPEAPNGKFMKAYVPNKKGKREIGFVFSKDLQAIPGELPGKKNSIFIEKEEAPQEEVTFARIEELKEIPSPESLEEDKPITVMAELSDAPNFGGVEEVDNTTQEPSIYESIAVTVMPYCLNFTQIRLKIGYPDHIKKEKIIGSVIMRVLVDENGKYVRHQLHNKTAHPKLIEVVEPYVSQLQFRPARNGSVPIKCWTNVRFAFASN
ncbi:MAG: LamG-like jellyroll fold domain-containing protein [Bacteroidota bacterium]